MKKLLFSLICFSAFSTQAMNIGGWWKKILNCENQLVNHISLKTTRQKINSIELIAPDTHLATTVNSILNGITPGNKVQPNILYYYDEHDTTTAEQLNENILINIAHLPSLQGDTPHNYYVYYLQLKYILAHELSHIQHKHHQKNCRVALYSLVLSTFAGSHGIISFSPKKIVTCLLTMPIVIYMTRKYSSHRAAQHERQADLDALSWIKCTDCMRVLALKTSPKDHPDSVHSYGYLCQEDIFAYAHKLYESGRHQICQYHANLNMKPA